MRLHRLVLTNYRGVAHREIALPDHGVVVVCGANEIGKSSMIEALDLLLESKDRSTKKDVKQVKPTHADVGSEVTAEISCGPYRFVYHKRFHKRCETRLTVLAPRREQLTGDEAHDRVRAMLAETVDTELWRAQRVLQAASTAAVDLSGCDALSRALDVAAGDTAALSGTEPLLIERIDAEYARYFTPTGRPTGEWAAAVSRLADAEDAVARCAAALAEVDERVRRHAALTDELAGLSPQQQAADARYAAAQAAAANVAALTEKHREAKLIETAAAATSAATIAAHSERLRLRTEIDTRTATVTALDAEVRAATEAQASAGAVAATANATAEEATLVLAAARRTVDLWHRIEKAAAAVDHAGEQLALMSATVEVIAAADIELAVGEQRVPLPAGQSWSITVTTSTEIEVPGVLTARVSPGTTALDIQAKYGAAQQELAAALATGEVADLATAEAECAAADAECETHRRVAVVAGRQLAESSTRATVLQNNLATQRADLDEATDRLARQRTAVGDEDLAAKADTERQAAHTAQRRLAELSEELAAAAPEAVVAELADATAAVDALRTRQDAATRALQEVSVELAVFGTEGRKGKLDAAETEREHAASQYTRVGQRARAVKLLRSTMVRHRDNTRLRYVEPFRAELQRLGRPVFGPTFEVDVDSDLCIRNRTLDGITVPYESLSGGAQEQLGILVRLAGAALVAKEDSVPVLIDDALGFTDPDRLAKMSEVFDMIGAHGQVIVLTCSPARYDGLNGAHRIDLTPPNV